MRYLHTMLRVNNLDESIAFYRDVLGMNLISKTDNEVGRYSLAFMSYGKTKDDASIELTYNWGRDSYTLGDAFGHIALATDNVAKTCDAVKAKGGKVTREAGPVIGGATIIAFVEDPNGYKIELIQRES